MLVTETFHGFIETTQDVLLVFEGCRRGLLPRICRRLQEKERKMIQSGSVFVFDERESGIKRWTDGRVWSPSRILGNFLIYRELDKRATAGEKRLSSAASSSAAAAAAAAAAGGDMRQRSYSADQSSTSPTTGGGGGGSIAVDRNRERQLVGSLSDSYKFRKDGLIKKTMSIVVNGVSQHLISYYDPKDVLQGKLRTPSSVPELASLEISPELLIKQNFRIPPMVESTFDHHHHHNNDATTAGPLTPPDSASGSYDHRMHQPLRSMSVGSIRPPEGFGHSHMMYYHHRMDFDQKHSPVYGAPSSSTTTASAQPIPLGYAMPSPSSMSSSPSTPMLSPVRPAYHHQRHYSTSSMPFSRNYSTTAATDMVSPTDPQDSQIHPHVMPESTFFNGRHRDSFSDSSQRDNHASLGQLLNPVHPLHPASPTTSESPSHTLYNNPMAAAAAAAAAAAGVTSPGYSTYSLATAVGLADNSSQFDTKPHMIPDYTTTAAPATSDNRRDSTASSRSNSGGGGIAGVDTYMHYHHRQQSLSNNLMEQNGAALYPRNFVNHPLFSFQATDTMEADPAGAGTLMLK